jgi:hypothetical protein
VLFAAFYGLIPAVLACSPLSAYFLPMSATNFNTKNDTYRKLMGNGLTYRIPRFQRDYSWGEDEWDDLWQDILGTIKDGGEPAHYMGYLVLQSSDDKLFDVIDGQQRLTTLSIVVLAALKNLDRLRLGGQEPERTKQRFDQLRQTYIGYLDPVTLVPRSKLSLNRNNDNYYQTYIVPLAASLPQRGFRASEHALRKAFEWFDRKVGEHAKAGDGADPGLNIAQLVDSMSDRLFFTVITVTDELNAYKVFETLNARGVRLSSTDLLKNYLFSVLHRQNNTEHEHELKRLEDQWESMVGRLGSESFPDFLRMHWNSRNSFVRQSELFKVVRGHVADRQAVFGLLRTMDEDVDVYLALTSPESSQWPESCKGYAHELRMFSVRQPFPLLMAAKRAFADQDFETLLRACVVISFRYNVIGTLPPSDQERTYHSAALKIAKGTLANVQSVLAALSSIYPNDDAFRSAFAEKVIRTTQSRNKKIVRYILCSLERQESGQDIDFDSSAYNIEHVLPQNPKEGWTTFSEEELESLVFRIGNMAMLESGKNRDVGNASFESKVATFRESCFVLTRKIADDNHEWAPDRIEARQKALAKVATSVWKVSQLS